MLYLRLCTAVLAALISPQVCAVARLCGIIKLFVVVTKKIVGNPPSRLRRKKGHLPRARHGSAVVRCCAAQGGGVMLQRDVARDLKKNPPSRPQRRRRRAHEKKNTLRPRSRTVDRSTQYVGSPRRGRPRRRVEPQRSRSRTKLDRAEEGRPRRGRRSSRGRWRGSMATIKPRSMATLRPLRAPSAA